MNTRPALNLHKTKRDNRSYTQHLGEPSWNKNIWLLIKWPISNVEKPIFEHRPLSGPKRHYLASQLLQKSFGDLLFFFLSRGNLKRNTCIFSIGKFYIYKLPRWCHLAPSHLVPHGLHLWRENQVVRRHPSFINQHTVSKDDVFSIPDIQLVL